MFKKQNEKGFTLIELMIVIAIIGILAAIAIPNFIAYRNKSFCSQAEADASGVAAAIADYFAIPSHTLIPTEANLNNQVGYRFSREPDANANTGTIINTTGGNPNWGITIHVTDGSGRCPDDYTSPNIDWGGAGTATSVVTKVISNL